MLSTILKRAIQCNLQGSHIIKRTLVKNSPCIGNIVYRKLSTSLMRKSAPEGKIEQRTQEEINAYVDDQVKKVNTVKTKSS